MSNTRQKTRGISLSFVVAVWTALVIAVCVGVYGVFQYIQMPEMSVRVLVFRHMWHVLVLGAIIHLFCWFILHWLLIRPINQIYIHLYQLGAGQLKNIEVDTSIIELRTIIEGMNLMIWRMKKWLDSNAMDAARTQIEEIGLIATQLRMENEGISDALMQRVDTLETCLLSVVEADGDENSENFIEERKAEFEK